MDYWKRGVTDKTLLEKANFEPIIPLLHYSITPFYHGGPCGTRTHDSLLKRQILYLLS